MESDLGHVGLYGLLCLTYRAIQSMAIYRDSVRPVNGFVVSSDRDEKTDPLASRRVFGEIPRSEWVNRFRLI